MADAWAITEAVATAVSTGVLVVGAVTAAVYGKKASPSVTASAIARPEGHLVLTATASIANPGVRPLHISEPSPDPAKEDSPVVRVVEVIDSGAGLHNGEQYVSNPIAPGVTVGPGQTVAKTVLFRLPEPLPDLAGWRVTFFVEVARWPNKKKTWIWAAADAFVELPGSARAIDPPTSLTVTGPPGFPMAIASGGPISVTLRPPPGISPGR